MNQARRIKPAALILPLALMLALFFGTSVAWGQDTEKPDLVIKPYHGNVKSKKFHRHDCRYYSCRNCLARFQTREDATKAGYYPCKVCKP